MSYQDHYAVLGVPRSASAEDIQRAYKKLARKFHPDISKEPNAEERFKLLGQAHDILKDPKKRALYDQYGDAWKAVSEGRAAPPGADRVRGFDFSQFDVDASGFGEADLGSIFETIFGGGFVGAPGARPANRRARHWGASGADHEAKLPLSVVEAFRGGKRDLHIKDPETGSPKRYTVQVPRGVKDGQRIRLAGKGSEGFGGGPAGDLYLRVQITDRGPFRLTGNDVHTSLPVAPWEAALGVTATVPTLDGTVRVKVPAGSSTGRKIRLRGKGFGASDAKRGDLYAEVRIEVPRTLSDREKSLMEELAKVSTFCPRPADAKAQSNSGVGAS